MADDDYVSRQTAPSIINLKGRVRLTSPHLQNAEEAAEIKKKRAFRKFSYRGIDLDQYAQPQNHPLHHT
jgi:hypothetical protein